MRERVKEGKRQVKGGENGRWTCRKTSKGGKELREAGHGQEDSKRFMRK